VQRRQSPERRIRVGRSADRRGRSERSVAPVSVQTERNRRELDDLIDERWVGHEVDGVPTTTTTTTTNTTHSRSNVTDQRSLAQQQAACNRCQRGHGRLRAISLSTTSGQRNLVEGRIAAERHLCRVTGNTVRSRTAREFTRSGEASC